MDSPVPAYASQVRQSVLSGARAVVPALWHLEMANGLIVAERRRVLTAEDTARDLGNLELLVSQAVETRIETRTVRRTLNTARTFTLSAYDSVYLDLARDEGLHLATLDRSLRAAAAHAGVELFG